MMTVFDGVLDRARPIGPDDSFFDAGGHSLIAVRLIGRIERELGIRITLRMLHDAPTPRRLAEAVRSGRDARESHQADDDDLSALVVPIQPRGHRPPIFGIHTLGPGGDFYRPLASRLGLRQPLYGVTALDFATRPSTSVAELARLYMATIHRFHPHGPLLLVAFCSGSIIAFETARQFGLAGRKVHVLALLDAPGPGHTYLTGMRRLLAHVRALRRRRTSHLMTMIKNPLRDTYLAIGLGIRRALGIEPSERLLEHEFALATVAVNGGHEPGPYHGPLTVFHAADQILDAPESVAAGFGWAPVAAGGVDVIEVTGGHVSMLTEPDVAELAARLDAIIRDAVVD